MLNRLVGHNSELTFRADHLHSACSGNYLLYTSERGNSKGIDIGDLVVFHERRRAQACLHEGILAQALQSFGQTIKKSQNTASTCLEGAYGQQGSREGIGERSLCNDDVIIQPMMIMAAKTTTSICRSGHSATSLPLYITINQLAQLPPSLIYFLSWLWWGAFPNHLNVYGLCLNLSRLYFTQAISQYIIICMKSWFYEFYHKDIKY